MEEYFIYTFTSTHGAIATEKLLKSIGCMVMPVPRQISASCGISVRITPDKFAAASELFKEKTDLSDEEFEIYHITRSTADGTIKFDKVAK